MKQTSGLAPATPDPQVIAALSGMDADAERALSLRTRRAVFNAAHDHRANRAEGHRNLFIALMTSIALTLLLIPAIWSGVDELVSGGGVTDLPIMLVVLGMMLFAAMAGVLFLLGDDRRATQGLRHNRR